MEEFYKNPDTKILAISYAKKNRGTGNLDYLIKTWGLDIDDIYSDAWISVLGALGRNPELKFESHMAFCSYLGSAIASAINQSIKEIKKQKESIYYFSGSADSRRLKDEYGGMSVLPDSVKRECDYEDPNPIWDEILAMPSGDVQYELKIDRMLEAVKRLPPNHKKAIELTRLGGLSYKEAAKEMNCSVRSIANWVGRGKRLIKKIMEKSGRKNKL